jgi:anti-anti-sigma factor
MAIRFSTTENGDVAVIQIQGRLQAFAEAAELLQLVTEQLDRGQVKIALDMSLVSYIDSVGVGTLVTANVRVMNKGGNLVIAAPAPRVRDLLQVVAKLNTVIPMYASVQDAMEALRKYKPRRVGGTP